MVLRERALIKERKGRTAAQDRLMDPTQIHDNDIINMYNSVLAQHMGEANNEERPGEPATHEDAETHGEITGVPAAYEDVETHEEGPGEPAAYVDVETEPAVSTEVNGNIDQAPALSGAKNEESSTQVNSNTHDDAINSLLGQYLDNLNNSTKVNKIKERGQSESDTVFEEGQSKGSGKKRKKRKNRMSSDSDVNSMQRDSKDRKEMDSNFERAQALSLPESASDEELLSDCSLGKDYSTITEWAMDEKYTGTTITNNDEGPVDSALGNVEESNGDTGSGVCLGDAGKDKLLTPRKYRPTPSSDWESELLGGQHDPKT